MSDKAPKDTEQKAAEAEVAEFKEDLGPFVIAAETTRMPMVFTDAKVGGNPIIFANDSFLTLTGYDRDEVLAKDFNFFLPSGVNEKVIEQLKKAFCDQPDNLSTIRFERKDGSEFWADFFTNPVVDDDGAIVQHFISLVDTTLYQLAQRNAAMLIDELNHRVKNTLATVQSIVAQAVRNSPDVQTVKESIETRIAALSRSHGLLGREKWDGAGLNDLVREALAPFSVSEGQTERFTVSGDNIRLSPKAALALGIAFHELATNAAKYGAFSNDAGTVSIKWTLETKPDGRWLCLHWREKDGPTVKPPTRKGFGSRVIEQGLAHELEGKVKMEYLPAGIVCTIYIPAPQAILDG
ncbi:MAG: PAS domain-containing protein [Pseudomonadota bacterium]|nr:PAS domain-containing protein [Pseudomonadota bacterium]